MTTGQRQRKTETDPERRFLFSKAVDERNVTHRSDPDHHGLRNVVRK